MNTRTPSDDREFDDLMRLYELYSNIQMELQTVFGNRANLMLVAEGLLLVALPAVLDRQISLLTQLVAALGAWLSLAWWILEQRNNLHLIAIEYTILRPLQQRLDALALQTGRGFQSFWGVTASWMRENATWYQTHSVRRVLRTYLPAVFVAFWVTVFVYLSWNRLALALG